MYHVRQLPSGTNVMRTVDTDVVGVALECFHQLQDKRIWVESGVLSKSFSINRLFDQLGEQLCKALPFYHAFTGCDYTSLFNRKRKITLFKFLKKYPELQETFLNLSNSEGISDDIKSIIESFVCQMYGRKKNNSVDQACVEIFVTKNKPKKGSASPNQIQAKKLHSSIIPPCCKVLHQKIKRYIYVASIWTNSLRMKPTPHLPLSFVLMLDEDVTYCIKWFEGDVAPKIVEVVKDDSCTCYGEFFNSKIQRRLLQNNSNTNFNHSAFFLIPSNQKLFFSTFCNWNCFRQQYDHTVEIFAMVRYVNWILWD